MCQTHSTAMPQIHRSSRFWFWVDYERSQDICGRIDELMILVMDPPTLVCEMVYTMVYPL